VAITLGFEVQEHVTTELRTPPERLPKAVQRLEGLELSRAPRGGKSRLRSPLRD
jgi:hypothetical protein